ncbi:LPXTG cell wall anchor domain-containing protein [Nocardiopsis dassonvillei]|uniref:LPXTG cell wall anchor domain-containing protein n=1 Tax=Nocardiopsis dassonvillei TaxID=2014 RepID=UPI0020A30BD2|nr:LPXTG cell wall anchor domain-containing protein [Nocardiopsis dassonvillei]MCP3014778.1 LPXTG cell wall anchor domain-containing protein [Nocardiopsis dassonvillei]
MKNTRVTARRILQGGAAFAALGALSIATALPAAAETEYYGWAYASVGNWEGVAVSYDGTTTNSYSGSVGNWLTFSGTSSATVGGDGVTATATVDTARLQITVSDVEEIVEDNLDEEPEATEETGETEAEESPAPEGEETEPGADDGQPEDGGTGGEGADGGETGGDENTGGGETGGEGTGGETDAPEAPETSPAPDTDPATEAETLVLDEESTELVSGSDEIVLDATLSGVTTTTTQSWDGEVSHSADVADISYPEVVTLDSGEQVAVLIDLESYEYVEEYADEENGVTWNDAYTGFAVTFTVDGAEAPFYYVDLAESLASVGAVEIGDGGGDNGGGDGDDKPAPTHPEDKTEKKPQPEKLENAESLAQTGSPIAGLIAAGAAIAAGGGLAAYFARRKKNTADSAAETSEG